MKPILVSGRAKPPLTPPRKGNRERAVDRDVPLQGWASGAAIELASLSRIALILILILSKALRRLGSRLRLREGRLRLSLGLNSTPETAKGGLSGWRFVESLHSILGAHWDRERRSRRRKEADFHARSFSASLRQRLRLLSHHAACLVSVSGGGGISLE